MNEKEINKSFERIKELSVFDEEIEKEIINIKRSLNMESSYFIKSNIGNLNVKKAEKVIDIFNHEIEPVIEKLKEQSDGSFTSYQDETISELIDLLDDRNDFNHYFRWLWSSYVSLHKMVCCQDSETLALNTEISKALKILKTIELCDKTENEND